MKHSWVPYAAIAAGASLLIMTVLVFATEDKVSEAAAVPFYFTGLLLALAAAVGAGLRARPGRRALAGVGLTLLVIAWVMFIGDLLTESAFEAMFDHKQYAGDQGPLGILGLALLALGARAKIVNREPVLAV